MLMKGLIEGSCSENYLNQPPKPRNYDKIPLAQRGWDVTFPIRMEVSTNDMAAKTPAVVEEKVG